MEKYFCRPIMTLQSKMEDNVTLYKNLAIYDFIVKYYEIGSCLSPEKYEKKLFHKKNEKYQKKSIKLRTVIAILCVQLSSIKTKKVKST